MSNERTVLVNNVALTEAQLREALGRLEAEARDPRHCPLAHGDVTRIYGRTYLWLDADRLHDLTKTVERTGRAAGLISVELSPTPGGIVSEYADNGERRLPRPTIIVTEGPVSQ